MAETAYSRASAAAKLFGVDLDVSLNKVSKSFSSSGNELDGLKTKLGEAGYTGKQAGDVLYQAWEDWLSKAKARRRSMRQMPRCVSLKRKGYSQPSRLNLVLLQ